MTRRTLRNWQRNDPAVLRARPGRPRIGEGLLEEARALVLAELEHQGWSAGEEALWRGIGCVIPRARVRRVLKPLKAEHRERRARHLEAVRVTTEVLLGDAIWSQDATHLGRDDSGQAVQAEVVREVASTRTIGTSVGPAASGQDVVRLLDLTAEERNGPPLMLLTDNGPAYRSKVVARWCRQQMVLHLFTMPHTPQHNAASERGMRDLKQETALGKGVLVLDMQGVHALLLDAVQRLDHHRLRASRGWRTAVDDDLQRPSWRSQVTRQAIWDAAACAIQAAVLHSPNGRARRQAIREAILGTLEAFAVIKRTRGGRT